MTKERLQELANEAVVMANLASARLYHTSEGHDKIVASVAPLLLKQLIQLETS